MLFDEQFYLNRINFFKSNILDCFGNKITPIDCNLVALHHYFKMEYIYLPLNYKIIIESEKLWFNISILDSESFRVSLSILRPLFDIDIRQDKNIKNSIIYLKDALEENNFYLYKKIDKKMFKRSTISPDVLIRVKDVFKDRNQLEQYYRELYSPNTSD